MVTFLYRCPAVGVSVTGWQADDAPSPIGPQRLYIGERCPACGGLHIVNPLTGRLLSEETSDALIQVKASQQLVPALH